MKYLSVCSGIEAASVGFPKTWEPVAFSEIDPFPCAVLKHRFPNVPNWGDMTKYDEWPDVSIELICGGTPCQSFSIAGLRKGLDDERGNLMLTFGHILGKYRPTWFVWENVPGVLSSNAGRDFASFLGLVTGQVIEPPADGWRTGGAISGIGSAYGIAYRVLDAQFTRSPNHPRAVPQRRRRVFVVGHLGDWRRAAAVLLDSESVSRNPPPRRETGQRVAGTLKGGSGERGYPDPSDGNGGGLIAAEISGACQARDYKGVGSDSIGPQMEPFVAHVYENHAQDSRVKELDGVCTTVHAKYGMGGGNIPLVTCMSSGQANAEIVSDGSPSLTCLHEAPIVAIQGTVIGRTEHAGPQGSGANDDGAMFTLTKTDQHAVAIRTAQTSANGHGIADNVAHTIDQAQGQAVAHPVVLGGLQDHQTPRTDGASPCLPSAMGEGGGHIPVVTHQMAVRRLLPVECERLQGFEDDHTNVPYRGKSSPDGPRYKAIGNSMATNCMEWIGLRIEMVNHNRPPEDARLKTRWRYFK